MAEVKRRHLTAGPAALAAMSRLLGLGGAWRLEGFCALRGLGARLDLRAGAHRLTVELEPDAAQGLSLSAPGAGASEARLLPALSARLGARRLPDLEALLDADPDAFAEELVMGREGDAVRVPCVGQPMELLQDGWRNFYADQDFEVLLSVPESHAEGVLCVKYADLECYYSRPKRSFRKWSFLDWPEVGLDEARRGTEASSTVVAELEERDMIMGTGERADALVGEVRRHAKSGRYMVLEHLCTPIVMGEDFAGLAKRCEAECGGKALRWSQKDRDTGDNFGSHLRELLARPGALAGEGDAGLVNLFHFPPALREEELLPFLRALGLEANMSAFPDVDVSAFERLGRARWQLFCERGSYPTRLKDLLEGTSRPPSVVPAPYGLEASARCLAAIAAAAGAGARFEAAARQALDPARAAWESLRPRAAGRRVAFVVSEATLPRLLGLRYGHGAPLASMVLEMGFDVDLLYFDRHGEPPRLPAALSGAGVRVFRAPWELDKVLRESPARAVYSDVFFDARLGRAGKARFSSRDFEMGAAGAVRSLERLLAVTGLDFYARYGAHLRRRP